MYQKIIHHFFLISIGIFFIATMTSLAMFIVSNLAFLADLFLVSFVLLIAWMMGYWLHELYRLNRLKRKHEQEQLLKKLQEAEGCSKD